MSEISRIDLNSNSSPSSPILTLECLNLPYRWFLESKFIKADHFCSSSAEIKVKWLVVVGGGAVRDGKAVLQGRGKTDFWRHEFHLQLSLRLCFQYQSSCYLWILAKDWPQGSFRWYFWSLCIYYISDFLGRTEIRVADIKKDQGSKGPVTKCLLLHEVPTGEIVVRLDLQLFDEPWNRATDLMLRSLQ